MTERNKWHINEVNDENLSSFLASSCPAVRLSNSCQSPRGEDRHLHLISTVSDLTSAPEQGGGGGAGGTS